MTTIACNLEYCAGDSKMDDGGMIGYIKKVHRTSKGVAGYAGSVSDGQNFLRFLDEQELTSELDKDFSGILLTEEGIFLFDHKLVPIPSKKDYYAIGSGATGAMVAMKLKRSPTNAIKAVIGIDNYTGGEIDEEWL